MSRARAKIVKVTDDDLIQYGTTKLITTAVMSGLLGIVGSTISWIAIVLAIPALLDTSYSLSMFVFAGALGFGGLAVFRNRILRRIANRGFLFTLRFERAFDAMFWVAVVLAIYAVLARTGAASEYSASLSVLFMGLYFLLVTPRLAFPPLIPRLREARLCMLQFLQDWNSGNPKLFSSHYWLRRSLRGVEKQLRAFGLSAPAGTLFLGSCYSIFKGTISSLELREIADWLIKPGDLQSVNWTIPYLLSQAKVAEESRFGKPLGVSERLVRLPWGSFSYITGIIVAVPTIVGVIYEALKFFRLIP